MSMQKPKQEKLRFLSNQKVTELATTHGTPLYVYSGKEIVKQIKNITSVPMKTPLIVRFAMKANPHAQILKFMKKNGVKIDASSGYEVEVAIKSGFRPKEILLTAQQIPNNLRALVQKGVQFTATSIHQLEVYGQMFPGTDVSVRINPGTGSGMNRRLTTGGPTSGFGIWHEYLDEVYKVAKKHSLTIKRLHTHIGSGTDRRVWEQVIDSNIAMLKQMPEVEIVDLGGGFKVGRMSHEKSVDIHAVLRSLDTKMQRFMKETGRNIRVEIEPGTYLVANAGSIISQVIDLVDTGKEGFRFIRTNTGMNDILRPVLYGAQHPLVIVKQRGKVAKKTQEYVVIGHNCESGDVLTVAPGNAEELFPRSLQEAEISDYLVIEGCGAYCASMSAKGYNSYPDTKEVFISS